MPASRELGDTDNAIVNRVILYVNVQFKGNLSEAARAVGCSYEQLYRLVTGATRQPGLELLRTFARHSRLPLEWWTAE